MLFGIAGPTASGKTTVTDVIAEDYNADYLRYSLILSDIAADRGMDPEDKATLQGLYLTLRKERGEGWLAEEIAERADALGCEHLIIEGNRRKVDIETLKDVASRRDEKLVFIFIDASPEARFGRYNRRLEKQGKPQITWEEFDTLEQNPAENEVGDLRDFAKHNGIYLNTDEYGVEETKALLREKLRLA